MVCRGAVLGWFTAVLALAAPGFAHADVAFTSALYPLPTADSEYHSRQGAVALVDLNNDARPDIVVYRGGHGKVFTLLNKGDGTFAPAQEYPGCANTSAGGTMVAGQFDAGQAADVILGCEAGTGYNLLPGGGDGTLGAATPYAGIGFNNALALWPPAAGGFPPPLSAATGSTTALARWPPTPAASPPSSTGRSPGSTTSATARSMTWAARSA